MDWLYGTVGGHGNVLRYIWRLNLDRARTLIVYFGSPFNELNASYRSLYDGSSDSLRPVKYFCVGELQFWDWDFQPQSENADGMYTWRL